MTSIYSKTLYENTVEGLCVGCNHDTQNTCTALSVAFPSNLILALKSIRIRVLIKNKQTKKSADCYYTVAKRLPDRWIWTVCCCRCWMSKSMIHHASGSLVDSDFLSLVSVFLSFSDMMKWLSPSNQQDTALSRRHFLAHTESQWCVCWWVS